MADVLRAPLVSILQAIENQLTQPIPSTQSTAAVVPPGLVKWWVGRRGFPEKLDSGVDIVLWVRGFTQTPVLTGRTSVRLSRRLDVVPRTRLLLDEIDRLKIWLSGSGSEAGYFPTEEAIINALHLFWPQDLSGNAYTICPLHLLLGQEAEQDGEGWGYGGVSFEMQYRAPVNQAIL